MLKFPQEDFNRIILDIGQTIDIERTTRTVDSSGNITNINTTTTVTKAVINEINPKEKVLLGFGYTDIGDIRFCIKPSVSIEVFDQIIWNSTKFKINKITNPPRFEGSLPYKEIYAVESTVE